MITKTILELLIDILDKQKECTFFIRHERLLIECGKQAEVIRLTESSLHEYLMKLELETEN